jgi:hypothetical protein
LKYYVKLTPTQFIEQWVTFELYNELLFKIFSSQMTPLNDEKDRHDLQCVYCGGEWSSNLQLSNHRSKECLNSLGDPGTNKPISIPMFPNWLMPKLLKELKWQIKNNDVSFIQLKLRIQVEVNVKTTLEKIPINGEHIHVQVCRFKSLKRLLLKPH